MLPLLVALVRSICLLFIVLYGLIHSFVISIPPPAAAAATDLAVEALRARMSSVAIDQQGASVHNGLFITVDDPEVFIHRLRFCFLRHASLLLRRFVIRAYSARSMWRTRSLFRPSCVRSSTFAVVTMISCGFAR